MGWRVARFLGCLVIGGGLGALLHDVLAHLAGSTMAANTMLGVLFGGLAWFVIDTLRAQNLLQWLRSADPLAPTIRYGTWGEVANSVRRWVKREETNTHASELRMDAFLAAIQASPNGVLLLDAKGCIEWCNHTAASQFNIDPQRDLLQPISNLVRDPAFVAYVAEQDYAKELILAPAREGSAARIAVQLHYYGDGRRLLLSRDVTAIEKADAMRRDFVANVSHEIRTPLTVLSGFVETIQTLPLDEAARRRYLDLMAQQAKRMQSLVEDLLTLSRIEGAPPPSATDWHSVAAMLARCESDARQLSAILGGTEACRHDIQVASPHGLELAGNASELQSAISNLINNAVRYTPAGGLIEVSFQRNQDGRTEFKVKDNGPGIAPEHLSRLTERFYRVDRSRSRETGGTGLGLAIVKHVVNRHGASLTITSRVGEGAEFLIEFPAHRVRESQ